MHKNKSKKQKRKKKNTESYQRKMPEKESSAWYGILFGTRATNFITRATIWPVNKFAEKSPSTDHGQLFAGVYKLNKT